MVNRLTRGSAPDRDRDADQRTGSFKQGHKKVGGRKRGTPNLMSIDYKKALLEAAYRVGNDGNGKDGFVGYLVWVAIRDPGVFCRVFFSNQLARECAGSDTPEPPRRTMEQINQFVREYIGLAGKNRPKTSTLQVETRPWDWTGQDFPLGSLMQIAVKDPKAFCTSLVAAFVPPRIKPRGATARRYEPQMGAP
jgi:hypothetical protein